MKNIYGFLLVIIFLGCQGSPNSSYQKYYEEELGEVEEAIIEFDESQGEASVEKNFYFLFDGSGSMSENCAGNTKMQGAKEAINTFLDKVPDQINIGLLVFGVEKEQSGIKEVVPLSSGNKELFRQAITETKAYGGTPLSNAVEFGMERLVEKYKQQLGYGEYRLIIITDGLASNPDKFRRTMHETQKYPFIAIYGIGLCMDSEHVIKQYALNYTDAHDYEQLGKALEETVAELPDFDPTEFSEEDLIMDSGE